MIPRKKVITNKVVQLTKIYNFYFSYFFIWQSSSIYYSQIHKSLT